ncbi:hypothetical protein UC35_03435 [Ramlibacter tataouinensis]|uniref:Anti sigma-E protein RseA N-terminal domain-containing protein n=1 Tax=Ramlibacter tataouinensis TaxID=94132 RepID=A0A127JQB3_9BURK|nr:sigma-E factor negative regulatory protein [Ramlibacter tataouinensis]AMO22105.1 hypothetical protein UC35_03435 [Ramlibacter tataouinensis]
MGRSDVMEQIRTRELISDMADGRLEGDAFTRGVELAASDPTAREAWHAYHLIGDVLRSSELAAGTPSQAFLSRLQVRLQGEEVDATTLAQQQPLVDPRALEPAANDSSFRWKLVAGLASLAAVGAVAWTVVGSPRQDAGQLATTQPGTVLAGSERGVMIRDPRLDELMATHRQLGGGSLVPPAGYLHNATFDGQGR